MAWIGKLLLLWTAAAWQCGVTPKWQDQAREKFLGSRRLQEAPAVPREETLSPIRIVPIYGNMTQVDPMLVSSIKRLVMPGALAWYSSILKVHRVIGDLKFQPGDCWELPDIANHPTVEDADLVVFVSATYEVDDWVARAGGCVFDGGDSANSPLAGTFEFNVYAFGSDLSYGQVVQVVRHELAHILAFNSYYYDLFRELDGTKYEHPAVNITVRGVSTTALATPRVVATAKEAFACPSLKSLELENYGGSGTAGSHWEKRIMVNDFMVGNVVENAIYSNITLAIFEDSGWYEVNYTSTDSIEFGRGAGCKFFTSKCVSRGRAQFPEFCDHKDTEMCDLSGIQKSYCDIRNYDTNLPPEYQYFSDKATGGSDSLMDFCPMPQPYSNGDCKGRGHYPTYTIPYLYGEKVCENCMCFTGTYVVEDYSYNETHSGCHEVQCRDGSALVLIGRRWVQCPQSGGMIEHIPGFRGYFNCPPYSKLCRVRPCPAGCSGFGDCVEGKCQCHERHFGSECRYMCDETCMTCAGEGPMSCTSCYPSQVQMQSENGTYCACPDGEVLNPAINQCVPRDFTCHASCGDCFGPEPDNCLSCAAVNATLTDKNSCECSHTEFLDQSQGVCTACHESCETCKGPSASNCTSCPSSSALPESAAVGQCGCLPGYFLTPNNTCASCSYNCKTCSDWSTCTKCYGNMTLSESGRCECPAGTFQWLDECTPCDHSCSSCSWVGKSGCVGCVAAGATPDFMLEGCVCSDGYFLDYENNECRPCDLSCQSCSGPERTDCLICRDRAVKMNDGSCECLPGLYLTDAGVCESCPYKCVTCNSTDVNRAILLSFPSTLPPHPP